VKNMEKKKWRPLAGFVIFLAICTYFSATFESMLAARVTLERPQTRISEDFEIIENIVPASALVADGELYIAEQEKDVWGTKWVARSMGVKAVELGDGEVSIAEGLEGTEYVITSWDRSLETGMRVVEE